ncbi:MAG: PAS domain-containing sensor histidine kinase [Proteobacteria bacterium]|nr:PAS domain-containing sensor histidine kinase [Pseudomonadota bacterium]
MTPREQSREQSLRRLRIWWRRSKLNRTLTYVLVAAAVASGLATLATMASASEPDPDTVLILLYLDVILLLLLGVVVARRLVSVWAERRRGLAGSRLHVRLALLFSLVSVTPAILVAVFAGLFLNLGIQSWFSERVRTAIEESSAVASAYLHEHQQSIRADAAAVAIDLNRNAAALVSSQERFNQFLTAQASLRSLPEAIVVDSGGRVIARTALSLSLSFNLFPPSALELANQGEIAVITYQQDDRVRAMVRLNRMVDAYLLVGRFVDSRVLERTERVERAVSDYKRLEKRREDIQITFVMIFVVVALLLLLVSIWFGLTLATQLARPISNLIGAAERVRKGDLSVRVDITDAPDEIGALSRGFNRMTSQLQSQQQGLIEANLQLDERRRFTETVLTGVSAGVIGLDGEGRINLPNRSASELLATNLDEAMGKHLGDVVPEMANLLGGAARSPNCVYQATIKLSRQGNTRTLVVNMAAERHQGNITGYVLTFDDVTELVAAQRTAAWADVARRIAHEIKNPLTPIQLSAERLKRRYLKEIKNDPDTFSACTDTIVRQVEDIGRMVDEFSSFARMPHAVLNPENLCDLCSQAIFLERNRHHDIDFEIDLPDKPVYLRCDGRQVPQALTNLLKNAAESVVGRTGDKLPKGHINLALKEETEDGRRRVSVIVEDNGRGLPSEHRDRLLEPYVTTRTKGTGLGLAIVKKIMEDHNGDLLLEDREGGGARVSLIFYPAEESAERQDGSHRQSPERVATNGS